jgi:hypothetical protein
MTIRLVARAFLTSAALAASVLGGAAPASAQALAVKGGLSQATVVFTNASTLEPAAVRGLVAGGWIRLPLVRALRLQVEGLVSERGSDFDGVVDRARYLEVPATVGYRVVGRERLTVRAIGGGSVSWLLSATEQAAGTDYDITDALESIDVAWIAGGEVEWGSRWVFDVRWVQGFSNIYAALTGGMGARNRAIQVTAAYRLR